MNFGFAHFLLFVQLSCLVTQGAEGQKGRIRIIIPNKIRYVHHHPPKLFDIKKKNVYDEQEQHHYGRSKEEETSKEEEEEEYYDTYEHPKEGSSAPTSGSHEETDTAKTGYTYYAIPVSRIYSNGANLIMKPTYLYNKPYQKFARFPILIMYNGHYLHRGGLLDKNTKYSTYRSYEY